jgi:hypothetical protein
MITAMQALNVKETSVKALRHHRGLPKIGGRLPPLLEESEVNDTAVNLSTGARASMRVLLRNTKTMKYLGIKKRWTKNQKQARDFRNGWWATVYAFTMDPRNMIIDYCFDNDRYDLHIPVLGRVA